MSRSDDDDCAANRIKHSDGTYVDGPVTAPHTVWTTMLDLIPTPITNQPVATLVSQLKSLNA